MGEYYLHTNGSLIYKPAGGVELDSPFVVKVWRAESIGATPQDFVEFLAEAVERGANHGRVVELANHNHLDQYVADWRDRVFPEAKGQA